MRSGKRPRQPKQTDPEYILLASISSRSFSYYISSHGEHPRTSSDEATIDIVAEILAIAPSMPSHIGKELECSLISAVTYRRGDPERPPTGPMLYRVGLKKDSRSVLAYLPVDVFWGLLPEFRCGALKYVEARFSKPRYGTAELISLYFSETRPTEEPSG
jgi:hypothetical protein